LGTILIAACTFAIYHVSQARAQRKREDSYQAALLSYSAVLRSGMSREAVETYLREKNVEFRQMCCVDTKLSKGIYDDLVRVGQERAPWFCSENNVYIAFQFAGSRPAHKGWDARPSDTLAAITVFHWLEGCL
jgi:hypothetical protein